MYEMILYVGFPKNFPVHMCTGGWPFPPPVDLPRPKIAM